MKGDPYSISRFVRVVVLLSCFFCSLEGKALELYVKNRAFDAPVREVRGELFAPLAELLDRLGCAWKSVDNILLIDTSDKADFKGKSDIDEIYPIVLVDGRRVFLSQQKYGGKVYVPVRVLARELRIIYRINRSLGTVDLYWSNSGAVATSRYRISQEGGQGGIFKLERLSYRIEQDSEGGYRQLRGYAILSNLSSGMVARRVKITVLIEDARGKVWGRFTQAFTDLGPGERLTYQFPVWTDYFSVGKVHPVISVSYRAVERTSPY